MSVSYWFGDDSYAAPEVLWEDGERILRRIRRKGTEGSWNSVLVVSPAAEHPTPAFLKRLAHEYELKDDLENAWAARPFALEREGGDTLLVLEDPGGQPLSNLIGPPMEMGQFLRLAAALSAAVGRLHGRGLVHKDFKPANILVNSAIGKVWLTGFGIASRLTRERHSPDSPDSPEFLEGTLAYMAPEQTGRMNRSVDSRSDLYSLGITLYQMLTGSLPFTASDPLELVHCHIAKQPQPPDERTPDIPGPVSAIITKLLAKVGEERYQTAAGLESDLRRCLAEYETHGRIDAFQLGEHDTPDRLLIPEKLYGRASEINTLLACFDRVVAGGRPELFLISGGSGIGKSSVVHELHKQIVPPRGFFASGKFDQYKRDIPYAALAQAFQSLLRPLLSKSEEELTNWREAFREALHPNGRLITDLVPELEFIIGKQPPSELPPQDAQSHFQSVFRRFIGVFTRQHPLALFLDDLQWLDAPTLDLMQDLLTRPDTQRLMLIGAYRNNEVNSAHPLICKLGAIRQTGAIVHEVALGPLAPEHLRQFISDSLHCAPEHAEPLGKLIHDKTAGNPFFSIQFLFELADESLLTFHYGEAKWSWNVNRILTKDYASDIAALMVEKLSRLSIATREALQQLACLGSGAEFAMLKIACQASDETMHGRLSEAVRAGLIIRTEDSYKFLHDHVQEAAYFLIPEALRPEAHLGIGRLLAAQTSPEKLEEKIFEIVNQLNRGSHLIGSDEERRRVAELNCIAGKRAKASTAYASALKYLAAGRTLLTDDAWKTNYELIFAIEYQTAECELLTAHMESAEVRLSALATRCKSGHDLAATTRLQLTLYTALDRLDRGIELCLAYLRRNGMNWSAHPSIEDVQREYDRIWLLLGNRQIESLLKDPLVTEPDVLDVLDVLTELITPAVFFDKDLCALVICSVLNITLQHGQSDASTFAYVWFGIIAGPRFGNYKDGFRFAELGYDLLVKRGLNRHEARTCLCFACIIVPWTRHVRQGRDLLFHAFDVAYRTGDFAYAAYAFTQLVTNFLVAGDPLGEAQEQAEKGIEFAQGARIGLAVDIVTSDLQLIRSLRGLTKRFGFFDDDEFDEAQFEQHLASNPALADPGFGYWTLKAEARFFAGDYASAIDASLCAQKLLWAAPSLLEPAAFRFYGALSHASAWDRAPLGERVTHTEALMDHYEQIEVLAEHCPMNFEDRVALVGAEIARIKGSDFEAMRLYETAIRSARANGFVHNEAVANELAARFYTTHGFEKIAHTYLRDARDCYLSWGADGKVRQLEKLHPHLSQQKTSTGPTNTILAPVERLDLATVIRVSQTISGEFILERLVDTLMRLAIQNAGAERGLLILTRGGEYQIVAEATASSDDVAVGVREASASDADLPISMLHYVARTKESVLLHDASRDDQFLADDYVRRKLARSILCLPLVRETTLVGMLYLENNLAVNVFTADRIAVLKLLAAQAAISLENIRLYDELQDREGKIRHLFDSNIIGIVLWRGDDGKSIDANDAFLRITGYGREAVESGLDWRELTPPEWHPITEQRVLEMRATGASQPYEKEFIRKDGSRVPVLCGTARFDRKSHEGLAFVLDLTEQKRAERAYTQIQTELAHANRLATMGHLTASIAHEINQPIGAAITYANAGLNWLGRKEPNVVEARRALDLVVEAGIRAGAVVERTRALVKKAPPRKDAVDVNKVVREIIELIRREIVRNAISVRLKLTEGLPTVEGDHVQLQQVVLNLVMNAIEAMSMADKEHRELVVSSEKSTSNGVLVAVRDSGPGIAPESADRLFESFYTTKPAGLGMGLSICHSIIEAHRGRLWATANTPEGAVFQFTLPAK